MNNSVLFLVERHSFETALKDWILAVFYLCKKIKKEKKKEKEKRKKERKRERERERERESERE